MRKIVFLFVTFFILFLSSLAQKQKAVFDEHAAMSYIRDLAADSMMGRKSGQPGGDMAEEYVASRFEEWGVEPAGENGTYYQALNFEHMNIEPGVTLEIITGKGRRCFPNDQSVHVLRNGWRVGWYSGSGHFSEEIVFVGYGIQAPEKDYDDFADVDVRGKIALLVYDTPVRFSREFPEDIDINSRITAVQSQGARAVLICPSPTTISRRYEGRLAKSIYKPDFPVLHIQADVTEFIFKDLKTELRYLISQMDGSNKPMSFDTGVKAFISVNAIYDPQRIARNVLGKVSGGDYRLKEEVIIIGAHLDHIGINPQGEVMNGANDNASGVSVVMEIARVLNLNRKTLKRTVVFFPWAAEEQHGYAGLVHYCQHPIFPLDKTVAYINMDMVGHGSGRVRLSGVGMNAQLWSVIEKKISPGIVDYVKHELGSQRIHDRHTDFPAEGVFRFGLSTDGYHFKYHHSRDDVDLIQPDLIKKTGDLVYAMAEILATEPGDLVPEQRKAKIYFKQLSLIDFKISSLEELIEHKNKTEDQYVDVQLVAVDGADSPAGGTKKESIVNSLFNVKDNIAKSPHFTLFRSSGGLHGSIREGRTTVLLGLRESDSWRDDARWLEVYARQGIVFVFIGDASFLFDGPRLSPEGIQILKALEENKLLPVFAGLESSQIHEILAKIQKPVVLFGRELPEEQAIRLIQKTNSVFGLIPAENEGTESFLDRLNETVDEVGIDNVAVVNQDCLWEAPGRNRMFELISVLLEKNTERVDILRLISSNFLRVLDEVKQ